MVFCFYFPLIFHCLTPSPLATHISCSAYTLDNTRNDLSLSWEKARDFQTLPENQHSHVAFLLTYLLRCHCPLPPLCLANGPRRQIGKALCLNNFSILSAVTALLRPPQAAALAIRFASKKTGGSSKNLGGKSPGKRFGLKKMEGTGVPWLSFLSCTLPSAPGISLKSRKTMQMLDPVLSA